MSKSTEKQEDRIVRVIFFCSFIFILSSVMLLGSAVFHDLGWIFKSVPSIDYSIWMEVNGLIWSVSGLVAWVCILYAATGF